MAVVTTYVCDVSGVSGTDKSDFVTVEIKSYQHFPSSGGTSYGSQCAVSVAKLVTKDVATKLGLTQPPKVKEEPAQPQVTFESSLTVLLTDYIKGLVYEEVEAAASN